MVCDRRDHPDIRFMHAAVMKSFTSSPNVNP
jgi:hypothetical protein